MPKKKPAPVPASQPLSQYNALYSGNVNVDTQYHTHYGEEENTETMEATVESVKLQGLATKVCEHLNVSKENTYFVDRILRHFKVWEPEAWEIHICGGYYGPELDGVFLRQATEIEETINQVLRLADLKAKIEYILTLEYGYLLPDLQEKQWDLAYVPLKALSCNEHYGTKIQDAAVYDDYDFDSMAIGVGLRTCNIRLIDGYHRRASAIRTGRKEVLLYVGN